VMTRDEAMQYWYPAVRNLFDVPGHESLYHSRELDKCLGVEHYRIYLQTALEDDKPLPQDMIDLLIKLRGPHGKAILKAYQAQRGITYEFPKKDEEVVPAKPSGS
jgi:hypothetical protein